jgi:hypothetical protein
MNPGIPLCMHPDSVGRRWHGKIKGDTMFKRKELYYPEE